MFSTTNNKNNKFILNTEDFILYILDKLEPNKSDKIRLNKIAFFIEFAYYYFNKKELTNSKYAAINNGPIIDNYDSILKGMDSNKKIKLDGYYIRPLVTTKKQIPQEIKIFIDKIIDKYSCLNRDELIALSHETDSYKITTKNETEWGNTIDKKLAMLETFFDDTEDDQLEEKELPVIDKKKLVSYGF